MDDLPILNTMGRSLLLGKNYGFIHSTFAGNHKDFDKFLKEVIYSAISPRSTARCAYKQILKLRKKANQDFADGVNGISVQAEQQRAGA